MVKLQLGIFSFVVIDFVRLIILSPKLFAVFIALLISAVVKFEDVLFTHSLNHAIAFHSGFLNPYWFTSVYREHLDSPDVL